jgi:outer membrane protein assembly factor BamB
VYELTNKESITRIQFLWVLLAGDQIVGSPVLTADPQVPDSERLHAAAGRVVLTALREAPRTNSSATDYVMEAPVTAPLTTFGDNLYVPTADSNFVSLAVPELREAALAANSLPRGKFTTGGPIFQRPVLTDDSIYVVGDRWGLMRLRHRTLEPLWNERLPDGRVRPQPNADVARLLSVSPNYVFALDRRGNLLVIDAVRGATLSSFDVSAFSFPVTNDVNDRVYLAANSGLLLCLRDRGKVVPQFLRKPVETKKAVPEEPKEQPKFDVPKVEVRPKKAPEEKKAPDAKKGPEEKKAPEDKKAPDEKKGPDGKKE